MSEYDESVNNDEAIATTNDSKEESFGIGWLIGACTVGGLLAHGIVSGVRKAANFVGNKVAESKEQKAKKSKKKTDDVVEVEAEIIENDK